ncbi:MAG TPA: protease inhibitor I42 family protein [Acidimicrobiia bacterium]|nr:protease inhibitor I42 family protein [Acidimicrobiia bacterium]
MAREKRPARPKLVAVLAATLALVLLSACGGGGGPDRPKAKIIEGTETTDITVKPDQPFVIVLESTPSTGFTWTRDGKPGDAVKFINETVVAPSGDEVGAPGKQRFRYRAIKEGDATVTLTYSRPSEPDSPDDQTVEYEITVK